MVQLFSGRRLFLSVALLVFAGLAVLFAVRVYELLQRPSAPSFLLADRTELPNSLVCAPAAAFPSTLNWVALQQLNEVLPSPPGWEVRYNATATMARLGMSKVRLDVLAEMLDEDRQLRNFRLPLQGGRLVLNEEEALAAVLVALKAVAAWYQHPAAVQAVGRDNPQLQNLQRAIDKLTHSRNPTVRLRAQEIRLR